MPEALATLIPPDLWRLHWSLLTPRRAAIDLIAGIKDNKL